MKRKLLVTLLVTLFIFTGCKEKSINLENVYKNLETEYQDFVQVDEDIISGVYGVDTDVFKSFLVVMEESSATSKMYAVFEAKDDLDEALYEAKYFVDKYKESWMNGYFPEEEALVEDTDLETYGNYIIYVVNEDSDNIIDIIKES